MVQVQQGEPKKKHTKWCAFFFGSSLRDLNLRSLIYIQLLQNELSEVGRRRAEHRRWRIQRGDEVAAVGIQRAKASIEFRAPQESIPINFKAYYSDLRFDSPHRWFKLGKGSHIGATILHPNTKVLDFQGLFVFLGVKTHPFHHCTFS